MSRANALVFAQPENRAPGPLARTGEHIVETAAPEHHGALALLGRGERGRGAVARGGREVGVERHNVEARAHVIRDAVAVDEQREVADAAAARQRDAGVRRREGAGWRARLRDGVAAVCAGIAIGAVFVPHDELSRVRVEDDLRPATITPSAIFSLFYSRRGCSWRSYDYAMMHHSRAWCIISANRLRDAGRAERRCRGGAPSAAAPRQDCSTA